MTNQIYQLSAHINLKLFAGFSSHQPTTALPKNEVLEKISNLQDMSNAIDEVTTTIESITSRKILKSTDCSDFIDWVTEFNSIANQISKVNEIISLASKITSASVDSCTGTELSSLASLKSSLLETKENIEEKIEAFQEILESLVTTIIIQPTSEKFTSSIIKSTKITSKIPSSAQSVTQTVHITSEITTRFTPSLVTTLPFTSPKLSTTGISSTNRGVYFVPKLYD